MKKARQSILEWLEPKLRAVQGVPILREPEENWVGDCWRVTVLDENAALANGYWSRVVQVDRYRLDGDTVGAEDDCQRLLRELGFKSNYEALIEVPRFDYSVDPAVRVGTMTLGILAGKSWKRNSAVSVEQQGLRHYVLSLELVYQHN